MMGQRTVRSLGRWFALGVVSASTAWTCGDLWAANAVDDQIQAHLAAGEFAPAFNLAQTIENGADRDASLRSIARAQGAAGDTAAARQTLGGLSNRKATATERAQLGGGTGANFAPLMALIEQETAGPWDADEPGTGTISEFEAGVRVDPKGILYRLTKEEQTGRLAALGVQARTADINADMSRQSDLRMVSLTRLEAEVSRRVAAGEPVVESMKKLAGLSQIKYVFIYPESNEIVIAGPAEGWKYDTNGVAVGTTSGKPALQLDDMVTVLRTFSPGTRQMFGCSIDPRPEGLKAVKQFVTDSQNAGPLAAGGAKSWATKIGDKLGRQDITIYGVPSNSHVARVILEADYKMKLIGIGKLEGGSQVPDYFELNQAHPEFATGSIEALRWWLSMKYEAVLHSPDRTAFEIAGSSVQCKSENQHLKENGERVQTGKSEPLNEMFAKNFTDNYSELAAQEPVFADLKSVFDLALVAALIEREDLDGKTHWNRGAFALNGAYKSASYNVPKSVDTVVNHRVYKGKDIVVQVAGGVRADVASIVSDESFQKESTNATKPALPEGRWWWDAK